MIKLTTKAILVVLFTNLSLASIAHVPGDYDNIQQAIDSFLWQDTLLVAPGSYTENLVITGSTQNLVIGSWFIITGDTSYISQTIIDGDSNGTVVRFQWGVDSTLTFAGFTITNGLFDSNNGGFGNGGGGISTEGDTNPTLSDLIIIGNSTSNYHGAGMLLYGRATLTNIIVEGNYSASNGGGIYLGGDVTFNNVIVRDNEAVELGGGVYCGWTGSWTGGNSAENFVVENNTAREGGGIYFREVSGGLEPLNLNNFSVIDNSANEDVGWGALGGGIYLLTSELNLSNAVISGNEAVWSGGGIYITYNSILQLSDVEISGNSGNEGGGIYGWDGSSLELSDNVEVSGNTAVRGGGIACYGSTTRFNLVINNSVISNNSVDTTHYWSDGGGGIFLRDDVVADLNDVVIIGNSCVSDGGGIYSMNSHMRMKNVSIIDNQSVDENDEWASTSGGGIYSMNGSGVWMDQVEIEGNYASGNGGGIKSWGSSLQVNNSTITNNTAGTENSWAEGAGIDLSSTSAMLTGLTVSNNNFIGSGQGGGLSYDGSTILINSIIWGNGGLQQIYGSFEEALRVSYSDVQGGAAEISGAFEWLAGNVDVDPLFLDPNNGNYQVQAGSPVIDAGNPDVIYLDLDESPADMGAGGGNGLTANFSSYDFGVVDVREETVDWIIYNFRETSVTIDSAMLNHPAFGLIDHALLFPLIVEPFTSATLAIQFDPTTGDSVEAELNLWSANFVGEGTAIVEFSGTGYLPFAAEFEADVTSGEVPLMVQFTDLSLGENISWSWDFNDDGTIDSDQQNPIWTYQYVGVYSVSLTISDSFGEDTKTKIDYIEVVPSNSPTITSITDVPDDQGGWVFVSWLASALDDSAGISYYQVWGHDNSQEDWYILAAVPAIQADQYTFLAPTNEDSSDNGIFWSRIMISAHPPSLTILFESEVDSGYSIDNIFPGVPTGPLAVFLDIGHIHLTWNSVPDEDISHYKIYRSQTPGFIPTSESLIGESVESTFLDEHVSLDETYYYKLSARDIHGNEGGFSEELTVTAVSLQNDILPDKFVLDQNYPNPFNPSTTLRFGFPEVSGYSLIIYDLQGNLIKTLASESKPAGWHEHVWEGGDDAGHPSASGIYFARLNTNSFTKTVKMIYLR